jgi:hypothetical protein
MPNTKMPTPRCLTSRADLLKNIGSDNSMEICVHELEHQVNVSVIVGLQYIPQLDDVFVVVELL